MRSDDQGSSTRPYLIRALHDWCTDNGFTPYLAVHVDGSVEVPHEYVKNNEIVLNVGFEATTALDLGNEWIAFKARFGGVARDIRVPVDHVVAIYARENGQGMAFPVPVPAGTGPSGALDASERLEADGADASADAPVERKSPQLAVVPADDGTDPPPAPSGPPAGPSTPDGSSRPALKRIK